MLKNRVKEMSKKLDNKKGIEVIKDANLASIKGGVDPGDHTCSALVDCGWNSDACPKLKTCTWNG